MIKIQMTYDVVTPESAEHGDFADHGFAAPGGWQFSIAGEAFWQRENEIGRPAALAEMTPEPGCFEDVDEAQAFLLSYGPYEPSCSDCQWSKNGYQTWLTQSDASVDYSDGSETRYSFHFEDCCDPADVAELFRRLQVIR